MKNSNDKLAIIGIILIVCGSIAVLFSIPHIVDLVLFKMPFLTFINYHALSYATLVAGLLLFSYAKSR